MELREIEGRDMRDALERSRDSVGENALVVSHKRAADGHVVLVVSNEVPRSVQALQVLRAEARTMLKAGDASTPGAGSRPSRFVCDDVERSMRKSGCSRPFISRIVEQTLLRHVEGGHPLDLAAQVIGESFPVARARAKAGVTPMMAFLGPTGVGKTTTIAKLAQRLSSGRRRVALMTLDHGRPVESLRAYAKLLGLPYLDVTAPESYALAAEHDVVLLDTSGDVRRDTQSLERIRAGTAAAGVGLHIDPYLVLSASSHATAIEETVRSSARLNPAGCVLSKLDEVPLPGPILEQVVELGLSVAFLSDGASFKGRFHRAAPALFADLCLRGRLS